MSYKKLHFFESNGDHLNLVYDEVLGYWAGTIYLPEVSCGLYETVSINILEEIVGELGQTSYVKPISETPGYNYFMAEFEVDYDYSEDIYLYTFDSQEQEMLVKKTKTQVVELLSPIGLSGTDVNGFKVSVAKEDDLPITFRACLNSENESYHLGALNIYEWNGYQKGKRVAKIQIYGETVLEDERLKVLLTNLGMELEPIDYLIFKDSNILEGKPDWKILNIKRKELLLQANQIKPFIGTYKALLNAIKFFGYNNITLNEYWLNINEQSENFGKLLAVPVANQNQIGYLSAKNKKIQTPNSNQKKTSLFSLSYRLNVPNGGSDEWDIPTVDEVFDFSPDEVLIKLYGLKRKLQRDYLPLNARIVDIIGEGDFFTQLNFNVWNDQYYIQQQDSGLELSVLVLPQDRDLYIEDLRKVDWRLTGLSQNFQDLIDLDQTEDVINSIRDFYQNYYHLNPSTFYDYDGIPIGCPVIIKIDTLIDTWSNALFTWEDSLVLGQDGNFLTWDNWYKRNANEISWRIRHETGEWDQAIEGTFDQIAEIPLSLPYTGKYSIELAMIDLFNIRSSVFLPNAIEVKNKNLEIYGLTQSLPDKKSAWNNYGTRWNSAGSNWDWSSENKTTIEDAVASLYLTLDRANYPHGTEDGVDHSTVNHYFEPLLDSYVETTGPYFWNNLSTHTWQDGSKTAWYMTRIAMDVNASFLLYVEDESSTITLKVGQKRKNVTVYDEYEIQNYPTGKNDKAGWEALQSELINLLSIEHPILSGFNFNLVENEDETEYKYILAVGKEAVDRYDMESVELLGTMSLSTVTLLEKVEYNNPNWLDSQIIYGHTNINMLQHVTLSWDKSKMPGIKKQIWKLTNNSLPSQDIYYYNTWFTYLFSQRGDWSVELEVEDLNGNINKTTKNILTIN